MILRSDKSRVFFLFCGGRCVRVPVYARNGPRRTWKIRIGQGEHDKRSAFGQGLGQFLANGALNFEGSGFDAGFLVVAAYMRGE